MYFALIFLFSSLIFFLSFFPVRICRFCWMQRSFWLASSSSLVRHLWAPLFRRLFKEDLCVQVIAKTHPLLTTPHIHTHKPNFHQRNARGRTRLSSGRWTTLARSSLKKVGAARKCTRLHFICSVLAQLSDHKIRLVSHCLHFLSYSIVFLFTVEKGDEDVVKKLERALKALHYSSLAIVCIFMIEVRM